MTAMKNAILDGDSAKVRLLLKAGVPAAGEVDRFPFVSIAAMLCKDEIFDLLLGNGASITTPELLEWAVDGGGGRLRPSTAIVQRIISERTHDTDTLTRSLRFASVSGSVEVVRLLIQQGADPNGLDDQAKDFPLANAVRQGHADVVKELLDAGADPTQPVWDEDDVGDLTGTTSTLVDLAIRQGYPEIARLVG
jgi:ankyrin repeat protein